MTRRRYPGLAGRTAVITGAARGVGALLARRLADQGVRTALVGLEPDELAATAKDCGAESDWWQADVTDAAALEAAAAAITERHGRVDIVVANAGIATGGPFAHTEAASFDRVIEVNLLGSIATARAFLPALLESRGYLLQIASLAAITPAPLMAAYCAGKSGVEAFAHCVRPEVAYKGVDVGVAYLTWTDTDMVRGADADAELREMRSRLPWPLNRTFPLEPAVDNIVAGIARRRAHVYGQPWLRALQGVRGALPGVIGAFAPREIRRLDDRLEATRDRRAGAVGAGGAADQRARAARAAPGSPAGSAGGRPR
ncbi:SDR family oxidoreductase [Streptomonospora nanhaiensis]|uniref:NAD(P)-dependent dehydrogenase (Short-subunit alcohol dehydrogenase family) n=2 Tax=Streptomonospora nanhaiensis TaxID=1323731 RepID=A0A853BI64_9ACTN|nr:SDR family oxidoreductase [Streptomonospora nanhaiensis]MBV2366399.1 SDR family oxidoreductase [Streptomonospora nanhaiensis]NYI94216.1 NAD(P)-dependent dehydrogenase (short-subunit alcohol dehydrogenase family) [Streptomonospora nanhaiensis]